MGTVAVTSELVMLTSAIIALGLHAAARSGRPTSATPCQREAEAVATQLKGVSVADSAREAAAAADVVIVSLADDAAARAAYRGDEGLVAGLRPGAAARTPARWPRRRSGTWRTTYSRLARR